MNLDSTRTVRELATEIPNATRAFERLGIDYCCGGSKSLNDACMQANLPVNEVLSALEQGSLQMSRTGSVTDFSAGNLRDLIEHIISKHHAYVKQELPRLHQLLNKVVTVHGTKRPELETIREQFQGMAAELISHMRKEEEVLFPYIAELEDAVNRKRPLPRPAFGTVSNPVHMMEMEHDSAGAALKAIRKLTDNYTAPKESCLTHRTLFAALHEFETDLHQHVHLENNVLFPRAIQMEMEPVGSGR